MTDEVMKEVAAMDDKLPWDKKPNRHIAVALNHLNKRLEALIQHRDRLNVEIEGIKEAVKALE